MDVFGSSGVRAVVGEELTPAFVGRIATAAGVTLDADTIGVARDTRTTGRMLVDIVSGHLAAVGVSVERLGIVPTPGAQAHAERHGLPIAVITASHNPPEYNGIKLIGADGVELARKTLEEIEARLSADDAALVGHANVGDTRRVEGVNDAYLQQLHSRLETEGRAERIKDANITIAIDPAHGAGCLTSPRFFRELGCQVRTVNAQPDGHFPGRDPEPIADNLADLRRLVRTTDTDLGIAHDGDSDRAIFVDETGTHVDGGTSLAALAAAELDAGDAVVSAVNVTQRLVDIAADAGAELELTPIGSTNLITRIRELQDEGTPVPIAGEGNGGVFFPDYRIARDGAYTAARFLDLIVDRPASELVADHDDHVSLRRDLEYEDNDDRAAMLEAAESHARAADADLTTIDGYRLDHGDAWVLVRPSGTEPLIRVYAEARDRDRAETVLERMVDATADG
jgi:phosphomannomutase/phosphoglucomutase